MSLSPLHACTLLLQVIRRLTAFCTLLLLGIGASLDAAKAESLVGDISTRAIKITSNFAGSHVVVFGMIERDRQTISRAEPYDLIVVVRGEDQELVSRRKERTGGIWINRNSRTYKNAPNFYSMASSRKLEDIATPDLLAQLQVGSQYLMLPKDAKGKAALDDNDPFRKAALRLKMDEGLYRDNISSIVFLNKSLFRANIDIPAKVEVGQYDVTIHLLRGGALLHSITERLVVSKSGFEQVSSSLAYDHPFFYGLLSVIIALITGWFAGVVFRKN